MVYSLQKRHSEIFLTHPEGTLINCTTAFNKAAVTKFFNDLEPFLGIDPTRIGNIDETGISTVARLPRFLEKRSKPTEALRTSGENGTNTIALCCALRQQGVTFHTCYLQEMVNGSTFYKGCFGKINW